MQGLRNRFVTGDWEAGAARSAARPGEEGEEGVEGGEGEEEVFGDFEDVETGANSQQTNSLNRHTGNLGAEQVLGQEQQPSAWVGEAWDLSSP